MFHGENPVESVLVEGIDDPAPVHLAEAGDSVSPPADVPGVFPVHGDAGPSVAVALQASVINYRENEDMFKAMNAARQVLYRITTEIRTAQTVYIVGETAEQCSMRTADGSVVRYQYDSNSGNLYLETGGNSYLMCENISAMNFVRATVVGDPTRVRNVQISMTVAVDSISQEVCTAAVVRRNL